MKRSRSRSGPQEHEEPTTDVFAAMDDYMNSTEEATPSMNDLADPSAHESGLSPSEAAGDCHNVPPSPANAAVFQGAGSLALSQLPKELRPSPPTVCQVCPGSLWTGSPRDAQCWCRIMHFTSWSSNAPYQRIACDGIAIAEQMAGE